MRQRVESMKVGRGTEDGVQIGPLINGDAVDKAAALVDDAVEEIFGPVLSIVTFTDENEAVRIANDTEFGLIGYAVTRDLRRGQRLIEALQAGMLGPNVGVVSNAAAPFGGVKPSGIGHEAASRESRSTSRPSTR